ncbi:MULTISPECIES: glutathione S-transferase [unclassified Sphingomonas]|uniref:glutathione S-transferase n=1 Tax=unclassified Sphingomonas TaxID=196159 RepID=UPI0006F6FEC0|nr:MULTISPECIES: glutathione S-transferase [unclassified Sphingomonas]KQX17579.1 glutathione S-transferase [Sphingomonas sp. Root1294]KQY70506.1 glutathione S-transferase [Sphingomonas sp. Root50]KRB92008.1 glutathione S-transferase [Sphingomonas sp. Root720]
MTLRIFIGNKVYSSWSLRGWLAVRQSGLPFEEEVVSLYDDAWPALRESPVFAPSNGKVPIVWDGDNAVWESLAIIDYLADKVGRDRYWPADDAARALARSMASEMHAGYTALRSQHTMNLRHVYPPEPLTPEVAADVQRIASLWDQAKERFGRDGDYLFGAFGAVDIMFAPVVSRFRTYSIPLPALASDYCEAVWAHPFMVDWSRGAAGESWVIEKFERAAEQA